MFTDQSSQMEPGVDTGTARRLTRGMTQSRQTLTLIETFADLKCITLFQSWITV